MTLLGRLLSGGFMVLDRQLLSAPDVHATKEKRQYLVVSCRGSPDPVPAI